jgi:hypothetical protein
MLADQMPSGGAHRVEIEPVEHPSHQAALDRRPHRRIKQHIAVAPPARREAGVEVGWHRRTPLHRDVGRQVAVGAAHPRKGIALHRRIEVHHLVQRVHTGIGATGAHGAHARVGKG